MHAGQIILDRSAVCYFSSVRIVGWSPGLLARSNKYICTGMDKPQHTYHLHIAGQVQGVGFRPFVWRLAQQVALQGWVNNTTDGVHVLFNAREETARAFVQALLEQAPPLSRITHHVLQAVKKQEFSDFKIVHSTDEAPPNLLLTPDFGICDDCCRELQDPSNRRHGYPFITCTNCGPRFSIVTGLPYDRERTTMQAFQQCAACQLEYDNPADRRYYSQTNSCPECGIQLAFTEAGSRPNTPPLESALACLLAGKILAVKGIGGYLLLCDATDESALETLRIRKRRPDKPFALLYANLQELEKDALVTESEYKILISPQAPILLLPLREKPASGLCSKQVAPGLKQIGAMLPYAPLLELLAHAFNRPLVATSGNISGSPIIYDDEKARQELLGIADGILSHNRDIAIPQDDSVLRFSPVHQQKIILRRSRGYAPTFLFDFPKNIRLKPNAEKLQTPKLQTSKLAMGALMKSTFAWQHSGNLYLSQYLGELGSFDTQETFEHTLRHFLDLFRGRPEQIVVDMHPDYFSSHLGKLMAREWSIPAVEVQHHEAHFAAVLAENGYFAAEKNLEQLILGVIWDGTGYGDDGQVWGGEFFRFDGQGIARVSHFEPFDFLLGDKMPREPRISALSLARLAQVQPPLLEEKFTQQEWALYQKMLSKGGLLHTSSVGRLFDGVACLLGLCSISSYEGQAAMLLEQSAASYFQKNGLAALAPYSLGAPETGLAPTGALVRQVVEDLAAGTQKEKVAARFHRSLIEIIRQQARQQECSILAFSGGVWQNALLVDLAIEHLHGEFELLFHRQISPNDECVAFGQLFV